MNQKSEQLNINKELKLATDVRLSRKEISDILVTVFGNCLSVEKICDHKVYIVTKNEKKVVLLPSQISYLGNPHPIFKKRVQLKEWFMDIINEKRFDSNYEILLIGIYRYEDNIVFADFDKSTYMYKKMHNSSAHIYTNDIYKAMENGFFEKDDNFGNHISVIPLCNFKSYILSKIDANSVWLKESEESKIINIIDEFNKNGIEFNKWIDVQHAIQEMKFNKFSKWKECEWAGFYLEYKFNYYMVRRTTENYIKYLNNETKENKNLDFDVKFNTLNFFGDLKSSNIDELSTMLNDADNIEYELEHFGKLWYLIYEHETIKDKDLVNFPYTKARLDFIRKYEPEYQKGNDLTYSGKLKAKIKYKKMMIVEINKVNYRSLLEKMTSGFHQPNHGKLRKPKFKLTKQNIKNAIIYCYYPNIKDNY